MRNKQRAAWDARNRELAIQDAANRCAICRLNLLESPQIVEDFLVEGKCCSDACLDELLKRAKASSAPSPPETR